MKIQIMNLISQMKGEELNVYQKADALIEFNKLVEYTEKLERLINKNGLLPDVVPRFLEEWHDSCRGYYICPECRCIITWKENADPDEIYECSKCGKDYLIP